MSEVPLYLLPLLDSSELKYSGRVLELWRACRPALGSSMHVQGYLTHKKSRSSTRAAPARPARPASGSPDAFTVVPCS